MSIGVGFRCKDGIVLCADTQITWPGSHKDYECKIYSHDRTIAGWDAAFTFSGRPDLMKSFNEKFSEWMSSRSEPINSFVIQETIETVLELIDVGDNLDDFSLLCGIVIPLKEMKLLKTHGRVVSPVPLYDYTGVGDSSLLRYLRAILVDPEGGEYTVRQALALGVYCVLQAKTWVEGCGGDTNVMVLYPDGRMVMKTNGDDYNSEGSMLDLQADVGRVLRAVVDPLINRTEFERRLEVLCTRLREFKTGCA